MTKTKKIKTPKSIDEIKKHIESFTTNDQLEHIFREADGEMEMLIKDEFGKGMVMPESYLFKAITLLEFDKGVLLQNAAPKLHKAFVLNFCKELQIEYGCTTQSQKSLTEVVALNFVRVLDIEAKISTYLDKGSVSDIGVNYLKIMSQELDRAQRHYLTSLQAIRMFKMPQLEVNIKTQNAFVGNNQVLQKNEIN